MIQLQQAQQELKTVFGYETFRPQQEEIIEHVMSGKDGIVLMPTGGGKSVCFQIPALLFEGTTLVVSPLISLMKDQVEALRSNGVEAAFFNSSLSDMEKNEVVHKARNTELKLLYMAPETLFTVVHDWLKDLDISLIAIDEAHCVSMWGHDFRPEYTKIHTLRAYWKDVPFLALTATADKATRNEIHNKLGLKTPKTFLASFDRPNLSLTVKGNVKKSKKQEQMLDFLSSRTHESGIIYCLSKKETEEWADFLNEKGFKAAYYHAGLDAQKRSEIQEAFIRDEIPIITATIAFGMGIDKSNVRWVMHNNLPKNIEGYYQEIGRAGRDGLPSETLLYYNMRDVKLLGDFARDSPYKDVLIEKLNRMLQYAESPTCRRKTLLSYFGETLSEDCGNCDVCLNPPKFLDATVHVQKALSAIKRTNEKVGINMLVQILRGAQTVELFEKGFQNIKTYGAGKDLSNDQWRHYLIQMLNVGVIEILYDQNFLLKITPYGERILFGKQSIDLATFESAQKQKEATTTKKVKITDQDFTPLQEELFQLLREKRSLTAKNENVPPYIIFSDAALNGMVALLPSNKEEFLRVSGVGNMKAEKYGEMMIQTIQDFAAKNEMKKSIPLETVKKLAKRAQPKGDTYKQTLELYQSGKSIEEISKIRGLAVNTIVGHLCKLYQKGKDIPLETLVNDEEIESVKAAVKKVGSSYALRPIFDELKEQIPYEKIRIVVTLLE